MRKERLAGHFIYFFLVSTMVYIYQSILLILEPIFEIDEDRRKSIFLVFHQNDHGLKIHLLYFKTSELTEEIPEITYANAGVELIIIESSEYLLHVVLSCILECCNA